MRRCPPWLLAAALLIPTTWSAAAETKWYVRKGTWQETMFAARAALARHVASLTQPDLRAGAAKLKLGPWWATKTLKAPKGYETVLFPEKGNDPTSAVPAGRKRRWRKQGRWRDGTIIKLKGGANTSVYLWRTIRSDQAVTMPAYLGCDDRMTVWLNGGHVFTSKGYRGVAANQDKIKLALRPGENKLLIKVYNKGGAFAVYFSTSPVPRTTSEEDFWKLLRRDFTDAASRRQMRWEARDGIWGLEWSDAAARDLARRYAARTAGDLQAQARKLAAGVKAPADLAGLRKIYYRSRQLADVLADLKAVDLAGLRLAVEDLSRTFPRRYGRGGRYLERLGAYEKGRAKLLADVEAGKDGAVARAAELVAFQREALLANPLLDFGKLLVIRRGLGAAARRAMSRALGLPSLNSHTNDTIPHTGWDNEIAVLSDLRGAGRLERLYKPPGSRILTDLELDFGGERIMFSSIGTHDRWHIFEVRADGAGLRQLTPGDLPDVDHFDSCYLPDGKIALTSTAGFQGLPCENGSKPMAQLFVMEPGKAETIRQITFEQDSDWCPTVRPDGRLMYLRWEYSDTPHYFSRILFHANPDGTAQMELSGSNSYFPNAFFFARPIPHEPTKVVGVVGGHHGISRSGRLLVLDFARAQREADGYVREIPGRGKTIEPIIRDRLVNDVWPQFLHPYPLADPVDGRGAGRYFLAAMKRDAGALWGIYLVDVFDNLTLIKEVEGSALLDPIPLRKTRRPPVLADRAVPEQKDAVVYLLDVHEGPGLAGIPRGAVKTLRLFAYHYSYNRTGGHAYVGVESSWDVKRILGTVPVEADGSAMFRVPANLPISIQPLDEKGRALQIMRSWFVGMGGEVVSCVGCHEPQTAAPAVRQTLASRKPPANITPWLGPARPFSFRHEVQPVLDRYCAACHDGSCAGLPNFSDRAKQSRFDKAYCAVHPYVRRPGPESDIHLFKPMEYHASTSELVQLLEKGHQNVRLDEEAWQRLTAWIDLNAPYHGSFYPREWRGIDQRKRRLELARRYANVTCDPEGEFLALDAAAEKRPAVQPVLPVPERTVEPADARAPGWPFAPEEAKRRQQASGKTRRTIDLGGGLKMPLALVPAGEFVMGSERGFADERPPCPVRIDRAFWMATCEVTNGQFALFDADHDSRFIDQQWKDHTTPGYPANAPGQPVIRISWRQARAFCAWLSRRTGEAFALPTEAQWEWACRAGTDAPLSFGRVDDDFSRFANLADASIKLLAVRGVNPQPIANPDATTDFTPREERFDDGQKIVADVGLYQPNAWGLRDMHGNVAEWTRSLYRPYPYRAGDGRNDPRAGGRRVVRGGSWRDRPTRCRSAFRLAYQPHQPVFNVGFRVVCPAR